MRPAWLAWAFVAFSTVSGQRENVLDDDAVQGETPAKGKEAVQYTVFNDIKVPPMPNIKGEDFANTIKDGYW